LNKRVIIAFIIFLNVTQNVAFSKSDLQFESIEEITSSALEDSSKVKRLNFIANENIRQVKSLEAKKYVNEAISIAKSIKFKKGLAESYSILGDIYDINSDFRVQLNYFNQALAINEEIGNKAACADNLISIGKVYYFHLSDHSLALEYFLKALAINEVYGSKLSIAENLEGIGLVYSFTNNYAKALEYYQKALSINEELQDKHGISDNLECIGLVYSNMADYNKALEYFQKALIIDEEVGRKASSVVELCCIGTAYYNLNNYTEALNNYYKALALSREIDYGLLIANININIGRLYEKQGRHVEAREFVTNGLDVAKEINSIEMIKEAYVNLYVIDSSMNNFQSAFDNYKLYTLYNDSIHNIEKDRKLTRMQMQYDFDLLQNKIMEEQEKKDLILDEEIKDHEKIRNISIIGFSFFLLFSIILYRQRNSIAIEKKRSDQLLIVKEMLIKEIHHRVKNNLEVICSLLELQIDGIDDEIAKAAVVESEGRIQSIGLIHHKLYNNNENVSTVEFQSFINDLYKQIEGVFRKPEVEIRFEIDSDEKQINIDAAVPLGLILNELFTNSFKYAFSPERKNTVSIQLISTKNGNCDMIIYKDSGPGLPKDFDIQTTQSLGMKLIHLLSKQIGGKLSYYYDSGSVFEIPLKKDEN
jgi:two-component sensor histidine kinase